MIAVAVYQEDVAFYDKAINNYRELFAGISNKDGSIEFDYLRDSTHPQYTVLTWIQSCEIAWNQEDDLYRIKLDGQSCRSCSSENLCACLGTTPSGIDPASAAP